MTKNKTAKKYVFILNGINIERVNQKYGIYSLPNQDDVIPTNTTKINDLELSKKENIVSFLDESKKTRRCHVSMINFDNEKNLDEYHCEHKYKCFWDKNYIPKDIKPIGCPIKYIPNKAIKTYNSEISKEKYTINENVTKNKSLAIAEDPKITVEKRDYYYTDGIFCSFNCCMAYIQDNKTNSFYKLSESLLLKIYNDINGDDEEIIQAPHWRTLIEFGGHLTIEQFRESFNRVKYNDHGIYFISIGNLFEDEIKF